jgi:Zn-dependent M28 family amino/carboxypeptidase
MFWPGTVHRRVKYEAARAAGAAGFLIANRIPGDLLVTGSSGRNRSDDIPAAGISLEAGNALAGAAAAGAGRHPRVRLTIETESRPTTAECLIVDVPGRGPEWVVVSAHIDGHPLAESAIDNATGLTAALAILHAMRSHAPALERGLRVCLFNLEEWGLAGSARYLDAMRPDDRDAIALNVNLDAIAGDPSLTALTSEFPALAPFLESIAAAVDVPLGIHQPLMANSDHFHFARHGIPAFRLVAGFDRPESALRYVLTPADRRGIVSSADLLRATRLAAAIVLVACAAPDLDLRGRPGR